MKCKHLFLIIVLFPASALAACDGSSNSDAALETQAQTTAQFAYNGTFHEDVFHQICQNIQLHDAKISFPCVANELPSTISLDGNPIILGKIVDY